MRETPSLIPEIEDAIACGTIRQRLRALKRVTDLFVAGSDRYSGDQIAVFDDVLVQLTSTIELEARAMLAGRLAPLAGAPPTNGVAPPTDLALRGEVWSRLAGMQARG